MYISNRMLRLLARARADELCRDSRRGGQRFEVPLGRAVTPVTLRFAFPDDADALARLAIIDSSSPPATPVLLAEVGGELHAAMSLSDGHLIADPFRPTAQIVELLHARARQLTGDRSTWRRLRRPRLGVLGWRSITAVKR